MRNRVLLLLAAAFCIAASVPAPVARRPLTTGADPIGTWRLDGGDTQLVVAAPQDKGQLYDINFGGGAANMGKGLSDGDWLHVVYPVLPGARIGLGVFARGEKGVEGVIGLYKLGWELWTGKEAGQAYAGVHRVKGVTATGNKIGIDLEVRPAAGAADVYELVWQGTSSRYEGVGLESDGRLALARWGVTVTKTDMSGAADGSISWTTTTENRERPQVWIGSYKIAGDRLEGRMLDADSKAVTPQAFSKSP